MRIIVPAVSPTSAPTIIAPTPTTMRATSCPSCRRSGAAVISAAPVAVALWDVDVSGHVGVIDATASLRFDSEILADFVYLDAPRTIVLHDHRAAHVRSVNASGSITLNGK